jgi:intracellular sulfur oxidation DsrE/DsrF family protein
MDADVREARDPDLSRRTALRVGAGSLAAGIVAGAAMNAKAQPPKAAPGAKRPLKIVFHVSDADGWGPAFSNVRNMVAQHPDAELRVVVDGSGVYLLGGANDMTPSFARYATDGVEFQACHNALTEKKIDPASLPRGVKVVPAGVVALAESQREGYAYIKP